MYSTDSFTTNFIEHYIGKGGNINAYFQRFSTEKVKESNKSKNTL